MLNNNYTEKLIGIEDAILLNVENIQDTMIIEFKMEKRIHECPRCKTHTSKVHDYRIQYVKDAPSFNQKVVLKIHKRRHVCPACGKRFYEHIPLVPKYQRTTQRIWAFVIDELSKVQSMKEVGIRANISSATVARILDHMNYSCNTLPDVISIDEFKGNADGEKFQCILTNPGKRTVIDILPKRSVDSLCAYFAGFKLNNRKQVKYVVMDMSAVFKSMAESCFPNAKIVADKFHVQRLVTWAFEDMRKSIQKEFHKHRRRYFKRSRWLMLKDPEKLTEGQLEQLSHMLELSKPLAQAYYLLHEFRKFIHSPDVHTAKKRLSSWYMHVGTTDPKEFERFYKCVDTFSKWKSEILNAFESGLSNGYTEGCNNKIKVIKRNAYGIRNFKRLRKRILHVMAN